MGFLAELVLDKLAVPREFLQAVQPEALEEFLRGSLEQR
jgi:hypothetical protein